MKRSCALVAALALGAACAEPDPPPGPFCETLRGLERGEVPLDLGRNELAGHVASLDALLAVAPRAVRDDLEGIREHLVAARDGDDRLTDDDIVALVSAILSAGSETTALGGTIAISILLDHPDALERLRRDRSLIPQAVSEILRFGFGGASGVARYAREDFELRGRPIRQGQMLMLSLGAASHDPSVYPDPERFDIDRNPKDLLTFGFGPHYCLGANLARGELACMVDAALDFLPPEARVRKDEIRIEGVGLFDRATNFPVDFGDRSA